MSDLFDNIAADIAAEYVPIGAQIVIDTRSMLGVDVEWNASGHVVKRSSPGQPPRREKQLLQESISADVYPDPNNVQIIVSSDCPYAEQLEYGTERMAPRPYMIPVSNFWGDEIADRTVKIVQNP